MKNHIIINGESGAGKTTYGIKTYKKMISEGIESEKILVLVQNRQKAMYWKEQCLFQKSGEIKISSFFGFVQKELKKYWPIILQQCNAIKKKEIYPIFMTFEASQSLMNKTIDYYRKNGYLEGLIATKDRIARKFLSNIINAALSEIPSDEIGDRIYNSVFSEENKLSKKIYQDMTVILKKYMERALSEGVLDYSLGIYLYNKFLLKNSSYQKRINGEIDYLIVDDLEMIFPVQVNFINSMLPTLKGSLLLNNSDGSFGIPSTESEYLKKEILDKEVFKIKEMKNKKINEELKGYAERVYKNIIYEKNMEDRDLSPIKYDMENELKSEMNSKIINKVLELLERGIEAEEIAVIMPYNDLSLEYELKNVLEHKKIKLMNLSRKDKITDNLFNYALIIFACLVYEFKKIEITKDELRTFLETILNLDYIRSSLLADIINQKSNGDISLIELSDDENERIDLKIIKKYNYIRNWIIEVREEKLDVDKLWKRIYIEFLLKKEKGKENILNCRNLIDSAENFIKIIEKFKMIENPNYEFIKFIREESISSETMFEFEERMRNNYISLTTPASYFLADKRCKYQIWSDIRSSRWLIKYNSELNNPFVISKNWNENKFYDVVTETMNDKESFARMMKRLIKKGNEIYAYGAIYTVSGIEQDGILYTAI